MQLEQREQIGGKRLSLLLLLHERDAEEELQIETIPLMSSTASSAYSDFAPHHLPLPPPPQPTRLLVLVALTPPPPLLKVLLQWEFLKLR